MRRARIDLVDGMGNLLRRDRANAMLLAEALVWCLAIGWCFVAPKTAWGKARRGSIAAVLCERGATKPQAVFGATLRAAVLFASRFVARSSQTAEGYARRSRLAGNENSLRRNTSQLRDTTLEANHFFEFFKTLFNGGPRDFRRAHQTETLATKGSHHTAINHAPLEVRLNRAFAARQITDETADK